MTKEVFEGWNFVNKDIEWETYLFYNGNFLYESKEEAQESVDSKRRGYRGAFRKLRITIINERKSGSILIEDITKEKS